MEGLKMTNNQLTMTNQIVYFTTFNYIDISSLDATHYYGELRSDNPHIVVELKKVFTKSESDRKNKNNVFTSYMNVSAGDLTGFDSEEEVRKNAMNSWQTHFPQGRTLLEGYLAYPEPSPILASDDKPTMTVLNTIYKNLQLFIQHEPDAIEIESFTDLWFVLFDLYKKRIGEL